MLGSRKLLIVLCIVPCVLSLVCIGAFAAPADDFTPSVDIPLETDVVEDVVKSPSAVAEETFPAQPFLESSYYTYNITLAQVPWPSVNPKIVDVYNLALYNTDGTYVWGISFPEPVTIYREYDNDVGLTALVWGSGSSDRYFYSVDGTSPLVVISSASSQTIQGSSVSGTLVQNDILPEFGSAIFDVGDAVITFVMSSWIVMIPLASWLVVLCIGAIRKLVKGV